MTDVPAEDEEPVIDDYEPEYSPDTLVELHGLSLARLNGRIGKIVAHIVDKDRYQVSVPGEAKHFSLRQKNLTIVEDSVSRTRYDDAKAVDDLKKMNANFQRKMHETRNYEDQKRMMLTMGCMFLLLTLFMLIQTGALAYIYRDSFAAPYLQVVGEPINENVVQPLYTNALLPFYEKVIFPVYETVLVPVFD